MHRTVALTGPTVDLHTTRGPATVHRWRRTLVRRAANLPTDSDRAYITPSSAFHPHHFIPATPPSSNTLSSSSSRAISSRA